MTKTYEVITAIYPEYAKGDCVYARLEYKGRSEWKTKRIAQKHAREYKARHLKDAWVQEA